MKNLVIIVIQFFCVSLLFGEEYGYFKNDDTFEIDFRTGDSYNEILSNYILHNKEKIKCVEQTHTEIHDSVLDGLRESWVRTSRAKYFYNLNGNLIKIEDDSSTDNYLYTENGYYIGYEPLKKKYVYVTDNQRIRYNEDNTIFSRETITNKDNEYTVQEETTGYGAKSLWLTHKYNYKYEDKRILKFESTAFSMSGKERNLAVYDFEYDAEQRLKKSNA